MPRKKDVVNSAALPFSDAAVERMNAAFRAARVEANPMVDATTRCTHAAAARWSKHEATPCTNVRVHADAAALLQTLPRYERVPFASEAIRTAIAARAAALPSPSTPSKTSKTDSENPPANNT